MFQLSDDVKYVILLFVLQFALQPCLFCLPYSLVCKNIVAHIRLDRQYFADISSTNRVLENLRSASKQARIGLHIDTNDHFHRQIFGGDILMLVDFLRISRILLIWGN